MNVLTDYSSPNFSSRFGTTIRAICLHTTEGTDSRSWLCNPVAQVSAHYLVREEGIYRLVSEDDAAWHAGRIVGVPTTPLYDGTNPNLWTIGIEMEGYADQAVSPAIIARTAELILDIRSRRGPLPLVDHAELSPGDRHDPGPQNHAAIQAILDGNGGDDMDDTQIQKLAAAISGPITGKLDALAHSINVWMAREQRSLDVTKKNTPLANSPTPGDPDV